MPQSSDRFKSPQKPKPAEDQYAKDPTVVKMMMEGLTKYSGLPDIVSGRIRYRFRSAFVLIIRGRIHQVNCLMEDGGWYN